jgi:thiol-disulfide isomerase/thioredoxin
MRFAPPTAVALLLAALAGPAAADDTAPKAAPPAAKPKRSPLADEVNKLRLDLSIALNKSHPIEAATREEERAAIDKLLPVYERALKFAADHPDAPEGRQARTWAAGGLAAFSAAPRARALLDAALPALPAADRAGVLVSLSRTLVKNAGKPGYTRDEIDRLNAEAEAILVKLLDETAKAEDPRAAQVRRRAENELFIVRNLSVGKAAPEVVSRDLDHLEVKLSDYRGKVVVLDVWHTGCMPCRAMIPHERELVKRLEGKPFVLVSVSADTEKEALTRFLETTPMPWTHWYSGPKGGMMEDWRVSYFPTIYVLDAQGVIRFTDVRGAKLDKAVDQLLAEMAADGTKAGG